LRIYTETFEGDLATWNSKLLRSQVTSGIVNYCVVCVRHILGVESGMLICVRVERVDFNIIFVHFLIQTESGQLRLVRAIVDRRADTVRICIKRLIGGAEARESAGVIPSGACDFIDVDTMNEVGASKGIAIRERGGYDAALLESYLPRCRVCLCYCVRS